MTIHANRPGGAFLINPYRAEEGRRRDASAVVAVMAVAGTAGLLMWGADPAWADAGDNDGDPLSSRGSDERPDAPDPDRDRSPSSEPPSYRPPSPSPSSSSSSSSSRALSRALSSEAPQLVAPESNRTAPRSQSVRPGSDVVVPDPVRAPSPDRGGSGEPRGWGQVEPVRSQIGDATEEQRRPPRSRHNPMGVAGAGREIRIRPTESVRPGGAHVDRPDHPATKPRVDVVTSDPVAEVDHAPQDEPVDDTVDGQVLVPAGHLSVLLGGVGQGGGVGEPAEPSGRPGSSPSWPRPTSMLPMEPHSAGSSDPSPPDRVSPPGQGTGQLPSDAEASIYLGPRDVRYGVTPGGEGVPSRLWPYEVDGEVIGERPDPSTDLSVGLVPDDFSGDPLFTVEGTGETHVFTSRPPIDPFGDSETAGMFDDDEDPDRDLLVNRHEAVSRPRGTAQSMPVHVGHGVQATVDLPVTDPPQWVAGEAWVPDGSTWVTAPKDVGESFLNLTLPCGGRVCLSGDGAATFTPAPRHLAEDTGLLGVDGEGRSVLGDGTNGPLPDVMVVDERKPVAFAPYGTPGWEVDPPEADDLVATERQDPNGRLGTHGVPTTGSGAGRPESTPYSWMTDSPDPSFLRIGRLPSSRPSLPERLLPAGPHADPARPGGEQPHAPFPEPLSTPFTHGSITFRMVPNAEPGRPPYTLAVVPPGTPRSVDDGSIHLTMTDPTSINPDAMSVVGPRGDVRLAWDDDFLSILGGVDEVAPGVRVAVDDGMMLNLFGDDMTVSATCEGVSVCWRDPDSGSGHRAPVAGQQFRMMQAADRPQRRPGTWMVDPRQGEFRFQPGEQQPDASSYAMSVEPVPGGTDVESVTWSGGPTEAATAAGSPVSWVSDNYRLGGERRGSSMSEAGHDPSFRIISQPGPDIDTDAVSGEISGRGIVTRLDGTGEEAERVRRDLWPDVPPMALPSNTRMAGDTVHLENMFDRTVYERGGDLYVEVGDRTFRMPRSPSALADDGTAVPEELVSGQWVPNPDMPTVIGWGGRGSGGSDPAGDPAPTGDSDRGGRDTPGARTQPGRTASVDALVDPTSESASSTSGLDVGPRSTLPGEWRPLVPSGDATPESALLRPVPVAAGGGASSVRSGSGRAPVRVVASGSGPAIRSIDPAAVSTVGSAGPRVRLGRLTRQVGAEILEEGVEAAVEVPVMIAGQVAQAELQSAGLMSSSPGDDLPGDHIASNSWSGFSENLGMDFFTGVGGGCAAGAVATVPAGGAGCLPAMLVSAPFAAADALDENMPGGFSRRERSRAFYDRVGSAVNTALDEPSRRLVADAGGGLRAAADAVTGGGFSDSVASQEFQRSQVLDATARMRQQLSAWGAARGWSRERLAAVDSVPAEAVWELYEREIVPLTDAAAALNPQARQGWASSPALRSPVLRTPVLRSTTGIGNCGDAGVGFPCIDPESLTGTNAGVLVKGDPGEVDHPLYGTVEGDPSTPGHRLYGSINGVGFVGTPPQQAWDAHTDAVWAHEQQSLLDYAATQPPGWQGYVRALHAADEADREAVPTPESYRPPQPWMGGGR